MSPWTQPSMGACGRSRKCDVHVFDNGRWTPWR